MPTPSNAARSGDKILVGTAKGLALLTFHNLDGHSYCSFEDGTVVHLAGNVQLTPARPGSTYKDVKYEWILTPRGEAEEAERDVDQT